MEKRVKEMKYGNVDCNGVGFCCDCLTLKMKALRSIEASVTTRIRQSTICDGT
jgi:hypothetical protein